MEVSGQLHAPAALSPGKQSSVPNVYRRLGGLHIWSGRYVEEKYLLPY
jgi:hypothetical protein